MTREIITIILLHVSFLSCGQLYTYNERNVLENKSVDSILNVIETQDLSIYADKREIPKIITRTIKSWDKEFELANPGQPYDATDVVSGGKPRRQLISILKNESYFIMTYRHGGIGHHVHIMYFHFTDDKILDFWVGYGREDGMDDKQSIKDWLTLKSKGLQTNFVEY